MERRLGAIRFCGIRLRVPTVSAFALLAVMLPAKTMAQNDVCRDAMRMFHERRWSDAADGFDLCEQSRPGQTSALLFRGKSLINLQKFDDAAMALHSYAQSHPQSEDALYLLAFISFRKNDPDESLRLFAQAAGVKPPSANDLTVAALDYVLLKDYSDAAHYLELSLQMSPDETEARYHLGRVRYQQNQFDLAIAAFEEVLKREPKNIKAQDNLGLSLEAENQLEPAIAAYRKAIALDQSATAHSEQPYLNLGSLLAKSGHFDEAIPLLERAAEIAPGAFKVHYELARAYLNDGSLELARRQAEEAVKLDSADSTAHYLLGRIYRRLGHKDLADEQFQWTSQLLHTQETHSPGGMVSGSDSRQDSHAEDSHQ